MKLLKREIDKLFLVKWKDAKGEIRASLTDFIKKGFAINTTVGWLKYYDKEKIVLASERTEGDADIFDLTMIPFDHIIEMAEQKEA